MSHPGSESPAVATDLFVCNISSRYEAILLQSCRAYRCTNTAVHPEEGAVLMVKPVAMDIGRGIHIGFRDGSTYTKYIFFLFIYTSNLLKLIIIIPF